MTNNKSGKLYVIRDSKMLFCCDCGSLNKENHPACTVCGTEFLYDDDYPLVEVDNLELNTDVIAHVFTPTITATVRLRMSGGIQGGVDIIGSTSSFLGLASGRGSLEYAANDAINLAKALQSLMSWAPGMTIDFVTFSPVTSL